jgi:hypothetical protein
MTLNFKFICFSIGLFSLMACTKNPGKGGTSSFIGKIETMQYDDEGVLFATYPAADKDVFIVYGGAESNDFLSDKVSTNFNGQFKIDYLEKGDYTIYAYEDCLSCPDGKQIKQIEAKIEKNKSNVDLGTISLIKHKDPSGSSTIKGYLHVLNYNGSGTFLNEGPGDEEDIYLIYGESNVNYTDKLKTNYDGTFEFKKLPVGKYRLYAYQKCATCANGTEAVFSNVEITENGSTVDIGQLTIKK